MASRSAFYGINIKRSENLVGIIRRRLHFNFRRRSVNLFSNYGVFHFVLSRADIDMISADRR